MVNVGQGPLPGQVPATGVDSAVGAGREHGDVGLENVGNRAEHRPAPRQGIHS